MPKKNLPPRGPQLDLAGDLSVAFVNTAGARAKNRQQGVTSYAQLLVWGQQAGTLTALDAERLGRVAAADPAAAAAFARIDVVRASTARIFLALQFGRPLPEADLEVLNRALAGALPALRVVPGEAGPAWGWAGDEEALERPLWPVLHAAARLIVSTGGRPEVRQCAMDGCRLFFVDRTPSCLRRWCDMKTCGNRAKTLRHYRRKGRASRADHYRGIGLWRTKRPRESKIKL